MPRSSSGAATGAGLVAKRKYVTNHHNQKNPKRGGSGVLLTCETGREKKCRQEALDILNHYYQLEMRTNQQGGDNDINDTNGKDGNNENTPLSLDEEIKQLQTKKAKQIFSVYETGVRGTISLLCTLPEAILVAPFTFTKETYQPAKTSGDDKNEVSEDPEPKSKKQKVGDELNLSDTESTSLLVSAPTTNMSHQEKSKSHEHSQEAQSSESMQAPFRWDPVMTVRRILNDLRQGSSEAPSSRFVTRMIPIQVSCFTNDAEISHFARELFAMATTKAMTTTTMVTPQQQGTDKQDDIITFAIQVKRRICSHLKSRNVIELVAKEAPKKWKVNLSNPRFTVLVEICKTLCGMSIVEDIHEYGNFNLVETREQGSAVATSRINLDEQEE